jgi:hypothetical protein
MQGGLFDYALQTTYGTASYEDYYTSSPNRVNNRFNAPPSFGGGDDANDDEPWFSKAWWQWLDWQYNTDDENACGPWGTQKDGTWYFSHQDAEAAYNAWRNYMLSSGLVPNEDALPSYDDWLLWFMSTKGDGNAYDGKYGNYQFIPIGNTIPLLLFAFAYVAYVFVRRRILAKKSLVK